MVSTLPIESVEVLLGTHKEGLTDLFGPFPGRRCGDVLAYEMQAPVGFTPKPGRSRIERKYVLLDLGVSFGIPCWNRWTRPDGEVVIIPPEQQDTWYVDLDEIADACAIGWITTDQLIDGLRRWQRFLDRHLHTSRFPRAGLSDFPPVAIRPLEQIGGLLGPPVTWPV